MKSRTAIRAEGELAAGFRHPGSRLWAAPTAMAVGFNLFPACERVKRHEEGGQPRDRRSLLVLPGHCPLRKVRMPSSDGRKAKLFSRTTNPSIYRKRRISTAARTQKGPPFRWAASSRWGSREPLRAALEATGGVNSGDQSEMAQ